MLRVLICVACLALSGPALAHKVIASVFPSGTAIEGEIGFSNGDMAADTAVQVHDGDGALLGEVRTDADGFFVYTPTAAVTHVFRADLGAGHVAEVVMAAEDVAHVLGVAAPAIAARPDDARAETSFSDAEQAIIARIIRDEMRPLRREIAAYRERNDAQTILGGIGYILGLVGVGYYLAARQKLKG